MTFRGTIDNPYDPTSQERNPVTPPLSQVVKQGIEAAMLDMFKVRPCQVTAVKGNQNVDLQVLLQRRYSATGVLVTLPIVQDCMVWMPRGGDYSVKLPVKVGDTGLALFCDRSLDNWSVSDGGLVDPEDTRSHDLSDAIFMPGLYPLTNQTEDTTDDLVVTNGEAEFRVQKAGTFELKNQNNELFSILDSLFDILLNQTFTLTFFGPEPFIASTNLALTELRAKLDTLKGS